VAVNVSALPYWCTVFIFQFTVNNKKHQFLLISFLQELKYQNISDSSCPIHPSVNIICINNCYSTYHASAD